MLAALSGLILPWVPKQSTSVSFSPSEVQSETCPSLARWLWASHCAQHTETPHWAWQPWHFLPRQKGSSLQGSTASSAQPKGWPRGYRVPQVAQSCRVRLAPQQQGETWLHSWTEGCFRQGGTRGGRSTHWGNQGVQGGEALLVAPNHCQNEPGGWQGAVGPGGWGSATASSLLQTSWLGQLPHSQLFSKQVFPNQSI